MAKFRRFPGHGLIQSDTLAGPASCVCGETSERQDLTPNQRATWWQNRHRVDLRMAAGDNAPASTPAE